MAIRRFSRDVLCPICRGYPELPRGKGERCTGFLTSDGAVAFCSREEKSGALTLDQTADPPAYAHRLSGPCKCGVTHNEAPSAPKRARKQATLGTIVCTYPYHDESGILLFEVVRYRDPKDFRQRKPLGDGKYEWAVSGIRKVLYRLPELLQSGTETPVFVPEGEKDVDNLRALGLTATCNPGGASKGNRSKWTDAMVTPLHGRHVIFLPDNDRPGKDHAIAGAALLKGRAKSLHIVELPGLSEGGDASDWLAGNPTDAKEALLAMVAELPVYEPPDPPEEIIDRSGEDREKGTSFTDTRNARRLVAKHGEQIRFDHTRGQWRLWDGTVWAHDETEQIMRHAKGVVRDMHKEIRTWGLEPKEYREARHEVLKVESTGRLKSMCENARSDVYATHKTWDNDPYLFNCANGTVDLRTGELLPHRPERWQSKIAPVPYEPDAKCPKWEEFLARIFGDDTELIEFVQRSVGLSMIGEVLENILYVMWGTGANGKSTFLKVIMKVLGDYSRAAASDLLMYADNPQHSTAIAELRGVRMVATVETNAGGRISEATVKMLTGGDERNARFLFQDAFTYEPSDTFWLATNHKPVITGNSEGIWRRLKLIPFNVSIPKAEQDKKLPEHLRAEHAGILAWAVRGCLEYQKHGLTDPHAVHVATAGYRTEMDSLNAFLEESTVVQPGCRISSGELYKSYTAWCNEAGEKAATQRFLGLRLGERGFVRVRLSPSNRWAWEGLRLRLPHEMEDGDLNETVEVEVEGVAVTPPAQMDLEPASIPADPPVREQFGSDAEFETAVRDFWSRK